MMKRVLALTLGAVLAGQMAYAITADEIVTDLQAEGYTRVEVRVGPTQIKVEAIRGTNKIERIVDSATGNVLKSESYMVDSGENTRPGVSIRTRDRDFVRVADGGRDISSSDDDDNSTADRNDDDDKDSDRSDDRDGGDASDSDDDSDHDAGDDHDDDHGGSDDHDSDDGDDD
ncbi:PepSY domain-containing protein [Pseudorhodobacter sp. E13]|uniref:PepSY domain-containing protein n=1 Tax=Pseudorhodobacter sp. E13 TaxID=2487931 RepID=UPI000F8E9A8A|nr:PepSY domain-containing protein [Pseudorhodobacter sp. E13]RUS63464.1 PepSY domain-containing protein [Pseudorhodobacter sp. E13]